MAVFFYLIIVAIAFFTAFVTGIYANPHKNIILETTLPVEKLTDPQVRQLRKTFKLRLLQLAALFSLLSLPLLVIPYDSILLLLFFLFLFGFMGSSYALQIRYIRKMTELKIQNNWEVPTKPLLIDTSLVIRKNQRLLSFWWFLPAILVTIAGAGFSLSVFNNWLLVVIALLLQLFFIGSYVVIARLPIKSYTSDSKINQQVNDLMRYHWSLLIILSAFILSPIAILPMITLVLSYTIAMYLTFAYFILLFIYVLFTFYLLFSMRNKQDQLLFTASDYRYNNEDYDWRYGMYLNPNDPRIMVPDRVGMNLSINIGRPIGKFLLGMTGLLIIGVVAFSTVPLFLNDFSDHSFNGTVTNTTVSLKAPLTTTKNIPLAQIDSVQLIDALPKQQIRVMGTATEHYLTGEFDIAGDSAYLLIYTDSHPILEIKTKEKNYYFTAKKSQQTKEFYQKILREQQKN